MMRRARKLVVVFAAASVAIVVIVMMGASSAREFRSCGHRVSLFDRLLWSVSIPARHPCFSGHLLDDLQNVALAERIFVGEHGRTSTNLTELQTEGILPFTPRFMNQMAFKTNGTNWQITISKTRGIPFYLVNEKGEIFFNEDRPATQEDPKLRKAGPFYRSE